MTEVAHLFAIEALERRRAIVDGFRQAAEADAERVRRERERVELERDRRRRVAEQFADAITKALEQTSQPIDAVPEQSAEDDLSIPRRPDGSIDIDRLNQALNAYVWSQSESN